MTKIAVRQATADDLPHLLELENVSFSGDRISRRSWAELIRSQSALVLVATQQRNIVGSAVVLTRKGAAVARLYTIAVARAHRHLGVGRALIATALACARNSGSRELRLESRSDNASAHRFFRHRGFEAFGAVLDNYYQDGMSAIRFRHLLHPTVVRTHLPGRAPDFAGGPSVVCAGRREFAPHLGVTPAMPLRVWREATAELTPKGQGGCGPFGLAMAAHRRGFDVVVHAPFTDSALTHNAQGRFRAPAIDLIEADCRREFLATGSTARATPVSVEVIEMYLAQGCIPLVLISAEPGREDGHRHWVLIVNTAQGTFLTLDPLRRPCAAGREAWVRHADFMEISGHGRGWYSAAVVLHKRRNKK